MNLKKMLQLSVLTIATCTALPVLFAQQSTPHQRHSINARAANQQARINKGVADGQITPRGGAAADVRQGKIDSEKAGMRASDGGHLTAADRHKLARQQNRASQNIYTRNHNAATDPGVAPR